MKKPPIYNPIEHWTWIDALELKANDYNPNFVLPAELELLELSIIQTGWVQPLLVTKDLVIIDGFNRATISRVNAWKVPACVLDISESERMLLTIRINRAKGSHVAFKMSEVIKKLINEFGLEKSYVARSIGASLKEIDLLLEDDVFTRLNIKDHKYSKAWEVKKPSK
ncbi:MAG: ParB N-terminal domain-containing protein [Raineya sp.]|jgi:ParB-like chromosome segregation protein Spo0J|nr:ParB N-terminal domain-containing protein [Raineya sp.]